MQVLSHAFRVVRVLSGSTCREALTLMGPRSSYIDSSTGPTPTPLPTADAQTLARVKAVEPAVSAISQRDQLGLRVSNRRYEGALRVCGAAGDWPAVKRLSQHIKVRPAHSRGRNMLAHGARTHLSHAPASEIWRVKPGNAQHTASSGFRA